MQLIGLVAAVLATVISMAALSHIAYVWHDAAQPRTLSHLAAAQDKLLGRFRTVLWVCGTLFAVAIYGAIVPQFSYGVWLFAAWTLTYLGNVLLAVVPARGNTVRFHNICAQGMAAGMLLMSCLFFLGFADGFMTAELGIAIAMGLFAVLTLTDKRRFIFYELAFLYCSHISIVVASVCAWVR